MRAASHIMASCLLMGGAGFLAAHGAALGEALQAAFLGVGERGALALLPVPPPAARSRRPHTSQTDEPWLHVDAGSSPIERGRKAASGLPRLHALNVHCGRCLPVLAGVRLAVVWALRPFE